MAAGYDVIVIGLGGLGSVVARDLAAQGARVLGIDAFEPGHDRGSSHGATRVIRKAYFEHPDYVPLLKRSYRRWEALEQEVGEQLFFRTGFLQIGPEDGEVVPGVLQAAAEHGLPVLRWTASEVARQLPALGSLKASQVGVFEADAGYLRVEACVRSWAAAARARGAQFTIGERVLGWRRDGDGFLVQGQGSRYRGSRLVLCPGAWAPELLPGPIASRLEVRRKALFWYRCPEVFRQEQGFPTWLFELPSGVYYGFPARNERGLKLAEHTGGERVGAPLDLDRSVHDRDRQVLESVLNRYFPGVSTQQPSHHAVCMYTMTPDEHPVIGELEPGLYVGAGLSGHGFKMVPALGELLAEMTLGLSPSLSISVCDPHRDAILR